MLSSRSVTKFKWLSLHCSFTDSPVFVVGEKILTLSGISSSEILQGGSACRTILSIPSSMQLLTRVMQVLNFILGLDLYLLDGLKGGNRGGEWGLGLPSGIVCMLLGGRWPVSKGGVLPFRVCN